MVLRVCRKDGQPLPLPICVIDEAFDPVLAPRIKEMAIVASRNKAWLAEHLAELLPQARGRFVVVANQQAHVADTLEQADAWRRINHPDELAPYYRRIATLEEEQAEAARLKRTLPLSGD